MINNVNKYAGVKKKEMEKLLKTTRGNFDDLYTFGTIAVVDKNGKLIHGWGEVEQIAFPRSSAKLIQALSPLTLGAKEAFNLEEKEISQMCASHSGEDFHINTVQNMLIKAGMDESYLKCGPHYPFSEKASLAMKIKGEKPRDIHNNCSGKHTGMLMAAKLLGASLDDYYEMHHPCQLRIRDIMADFCSYKIMDENSSIDGCGVPVHAIPIYNFAFAMAKFSDYKNLDEIYQEPAKEIIKAITKYPEYMSGTDRVENYVMKKYPGKLVIKSGCNGYFAGMVLDKNIGFAIKTYDGIVETRDIILLELLKKLGIIEEKDYDYFDKLYPREVKNHRGEVVGNIETIF